MKKMTRHIPSAGKKSAQDGLTRGHLVTGTRRRDARHIFVKIGEFASKSTRMGQEASVVGMTTVCYKVALMAIRSVA